MAVLPVLAAAQQTAYRNVDPQEFESIIADKGHVVRLDVRTAQEYADGHISCARNIDVNSTGFKDSVLKAISKDDLVAVYCRSGRRSRQAAEILSEAGYNVVNLDGGIELWLSAAKPVVKASGWEKREGDPVMGNEKLGTCFDVNIISEGSAKYNMYFSWRPKRAVAVARSEDGINWTDPEICLEYDEESGWEDNLNRSCTIFWKGKYHMWYTGQARGYSKIGYAVSDDGIHFTRVQSDPVLVPTYNYEGYSVMNPYVMYDEDRDVLRMWYSSGETYEPNVLCYAESKDGIHWERSVLNPIFVHCEGQGWDSDRIGGCEVHRLQDGSYALFYIGYTDISTARICAAVSKDGIRQWKRLQANPLVEPTSGSWDEEACYKPSVYMDVENNRWQLWYNGRDSRHEFIGYATHEGLDLGPCEN